MSKYNLNKSILINLFKEAKEKDEFEFCCTLLRVRGIESPGWDSLNESMILINQILSLINVPLDGEYKIRLSLLLYCHITEMNDLYNTIANLLWILLGERYSIDPFFYKLYSDGQSVNYPEGKVKRIKELAERAGKPEIGELYDFLLVKQVRNAVYHSDYCIYQDKFRIIRGMGVDINGIIEHEIPLEWLLRKIEVAINVMLQILNLIMSYRKSYKKEKIIKGRMEAHNYCDVKLLVDDGGLVGFSC